MQSPIGNGVAKLRKKPLVDIRHESAILATMFNEYYSELSAENQANPEESIEKLLPILAEVRSELSIEERDTSNSTPILDRARHHSMDSRSSHGSNKLTPENTKMALKFDQQHARILEEIGRSDSVEVENAAFQGFAIPTADSSTALSPVSRDSASRESSVSIAPAAVSKTAMAATAQQSLNNVSASSSVNTIAMKRQPFSYLQSSTSVENLKDLASGIAGGGISYGVESMLSGAIPVGNKDYRDKLLESEKNGVSSQITMKMKLKSIFSSDHSHSSGGEQQSSVSSTTTASADSPRAHRAKGIGGMTLRVRANNPTPNEDALKVQARDRTVSQETEVIRIGSNLSKNHSDSNIMNKLAEEEERELDRQPLDFDFSSAAAAAQGSDDVKPQNEGEVLPASSSFNPSSMLMDLPDDQSSPYYKDAVEPVSSVKGNFKSLFSQGGEGNDPSYSVPLSSRGEIARRIMKSGNKDRKSAIFSASANELANLADKNGSSKSPSAVMSNDAIVDFLSTNDLENTNSNTTTAAGSSTTKRGFFKNLIKGSKTATSNTAGTFFSVSSDQLYTTSPETATSPMSNSSGNDGGKSKNKFSFSTITRRSKKNNFASNDELKGISLGSSSSMELLNQDQGGDEKSEISSIPRNKNKNPKRMSADSSQVTTSTMSKTSKKNLFSSSLPASNILSTEDENEGLERTAGGGAFGSSLGSGGFLANHD